VRYLLAIAALGLAVAIHELGHFLGARLLGIEVERFTLGFGPALFTTRSGKLRFTLGAIPLGGFARIRGMNPHDEVADGDEASMSLRPAWHRAFVHFAGPFANYAFALLLLATLYMTGTHVPVPMMIGQVQPGSAAARAQLKAGDVIVTLDGEPVRQWRALINRISENGERSVQVGLLRQGEPFNVRLTPHVWRGTTRIGVSQEYAFKSHPPVDALLGAVTHIHRLMAEAIRFGWRVAASGGTSEVANPVALMKQAADTAASGFEPFLRILVSFSVALALFNLLPFPGLDGGRLLFQLMERVTRRRLPEAAVTVAQGVGFLALLAWIVWVGIASVRPLREALSAPAPAVVDAGSEVPWDAGSAAP
jgi:regulator of sigma E protease